MTNAKHFNSLIDPEEIYHEEAPESWLVQLAWITPGVLLITYIIWSLFQQV